MGFQLSPGVQTKEIDLTTSIPAVATSLGATVGRFTWGPVDETTLMTSENDLVSVFGKPTNDTFPAFLSSSAFLAYANSLQVVRVVDSTATNADANGGTGTIKNAEDFEGQQDSGTLTEGFYARYPGTFGNGISVQTHDGSSATWGAWAYAGAFDVAPDSTNDEIAVAVVVAGEVEETYLVSNVQGTKDTMGGNIFMEDKINAMSKLVWTVAANVTNAPDTAIVFADGSEAAPSSADYIAGWDKFSNADEVDVNLLIAGGVSNELTATVTAVSKHMVENIAEVRKDCMAIISPPKEKVCYVGGAATAVANVIAWRTGDLNIASSYGTLDSSYKYTYDKYADTYRWIGFSADIAGLMANTDAVRDPWFSPAGLNRGIIKSVVKLAYNPNEAQRDQLYKLPNGINPIVSFPGQGTVLWGDRTLLTKPSAFDRINVRRLFIIIEKSIAISAKYFLFEFNNAFTRKNFVNAVEPYLGGLRARQAMQEFFVQCDTSNNTPEVVDANQFVASVFIKPSKSINYITLNFVATKSGVAFSEVTGQV